jgi:hypothetical protein
VARPFDPKQKWVGKRRSGPKPRPGWHDPFLLGGKVPGRWFQQAYEAGLERSAIYVGLPLWYLCSLHDSMTFEFTSVESERWGVAPDIKSRSLKALQEAGLIKLKSKRGKNPTVTLILPPRGDT